MSQSDGSWEGPKRAITRTVLVVSVVVDKNIRGSERVQALRGFRLVPVADFGSRRLETVSSVSTDLGRWAPATAPRQWDG